VGAVAFLAVAPFLMLLITDFLFVAVLAFDGAAFLTTVVALPSLVSL
jgi:hypothetical protein